MQPSVILLTVVTALLPFTPFYFHKGSGARLIAAMVMMGYFSYTKTFSLRPPLSIELAEKGGYILAIIGLIIATEEFRQARRLIWKFDKYAAAQTAPPAAFTEEDNTPFHSYTLEGCIDESKVAEVEHACAAATTAGTGLRVTLTTHGGETDAGEKIGQLLNEFAATAPLRVVAEKFCQSAGLTILVSVPLRCRFAKKRRTRLMFHAARTCSSVAGFPLVTRRTRDSREYDEMLIGFLAERTAIDPAVLEAAIQSGYSCHFTPQAAIKLGVVSGLV